MKLPEIDLTHTKAMLARLDTRLTPKDKHTMACVIQAYVIDKAMEIDDYHKQQINMFHEMENEYPDPDAWQVDPLLGFMADMLDGLGVEEMKKLIKMDLDNYEKRYSAQQ